jgi:hypothetical protein
MALLRYLTWRRINLNGIPIRKSMGSNMQFNTLPFNRTVNIVSSLRDAFPITEFTNWNLTLIKFCFYLMILINPFPFALVWHLNALNPYLWQVVLVNLNQHLSSNNQNNLTIPNLYRITCMFSRRIKYLTNQYQLM